MVEIVLCYVVINDLSILVICPNLNVEFLLIQPSVTM